MDVDSLFGLFGNWIKYEIPELNISSSFCNSSHALPLVILLKIKRISLSTVSNASKNVCRFSFSTSSMNLTIAFLSDSSEFFLVDMERYP